MTEIERLISRYLDGELSPSEQTRLRKFLVESPDARALLREMTVLGRAARRTPTLYTPSQGMEDRLFQRLRAEGLQTGEPSLPTTVVDNTPTVAARPGFMTRLRQTALVMAMLVAVIGGGYLFNDHGDDRISQSALLRPERPASMPPQIASSAYRGDVIEVPGAVVNPHVAADSRATLNPHAVLNPSHGRDRNSSTRGSEGSVIRSATSSEGASESNIAESNTAESNIAQANMAQTNMVQSNSPRTNVAETNAPTAPSSEGTNSPVESNAPLARVTPPPVMDFPSSSSTPSAEPDGGWMASLRGGIAAVGSDQEEAREMNLRIGMQMDGGHQIAMLVGSGPTLAEIRHENTGIGMSAPASSEIPSGDRMFGPEPGLPEYERTLKNETWLGLAYNYSVSVTDAISIDPGVSAGVGGTNWRVGIEVPVRYRIAKQVSMECAFSASRVQPHDVTTDEFTNYSAADHFIYEGSRQQAGFNSLGVQVGVRVDLAGNR